MNYDRFDISESTEMNKLKDHENILFAIRFQPKLYDSCQNLLQKAKRFDKLLLFLKKK